MRWVHFIFSHSIFISLCAIALCYQSYTLLYIKADGLVYAFVFFATLSSYNFYWLLSKYSFTDPAGVSAFVKKNISYFLLFAGAGLGILICLYLLHAIIIHAAIAIVLTLLYSIPLMPLKFSVNIKRAGFLKTVLLAFTWTYVTVILPIAPILNIDMMPVLVLFSARFFFIIILCIIFDSRDMVADKLLGLQSLATEVSSSVLNLIMKIAFVLFMAACFFVHHYLSDTSQLIAFIITGITMWFVYLLSLKKRGYLFYYFVVDGMMLFSAGATFIASLF